MNENRSSSSTSGFTQNVILTDLCNNTNQKITYKKVRDAERVSIEEGIITSWNLRQNFSALLKDVFLPRGYPESVSSDYLEYQIWDTCQAFCSSISTTLTMQAVMEGIGVGSKAATPISAAITWILKDGTGIIGSILFAWLKGSKLDSDCKKWRLFADILNDIAMFIELYIPFVIDYSMYMLCFATVFKAVVGTAGSSTRAALITHQAIKGNIADVSAKDGSQEVFINLCAFVFGILILKHITETKQIWTVMCTSVLFHLIFNYKAVRCLKINVFNGERFRLGLRIYLPTSVVPTVAQVNKRESVFLTMGINDTSICGYSIIFGVCLKNVLRTKEISAFQLDILTTLFKSKNYFILPNKIKKKLFVTFRKTFTEIEVLQAYFHAFLIGIALTHLNRKNLCILSRSRKNSPIYRLKNILNESFFISANHKEINSEDEIIRVFTICEDFVKKEFAAFSTACMKEGWNLNKHLIIINDWRADWLYVDEKKEIPVKRSNRKFMRNSVELKHQRAPSRSVLERGTNLSSSHSTDLSSLIIS